MRDEDFEYFVSKFGEATKRSTVPVASFEKWRGRLPDQLLKYWQEEGWCEYVDGLFCTVGRTRGQARYGHRRCGPHPQRA
ncbi:GAD-like domain-containing protein [uncultured Herbaspirillum sp.]|uniref:GAD-like domain-containing protein n=1 Tax=uncultured Herbaspirillum sp. TaxID=160236 RepID=UPI0025832F6A|nr:GAD-like domain-containing protein [uncultured Herbaspirillum sp.]